MTWTKIPMEQVVRSADGYVSLRYESDGGKSIFPQYYYLYHSVDGVTWMHAPMPNPVGVGGGVIAFGAGQYVLSFHGAVWTSSDLSAWTKGVIPGDVDASTGDAYDWDATRSVVNVNGKLFGFGQNDVLESNDGIAWTRTYVSLAQGNALAYGNGLYLLAGVGVYT